MIKKKSCDYYSVSRDMKCGDIKRVFYLKGKDQHYYCPECRRENYKNERTNKLNHYYNTCLNEVLEILGTSLVYEEKIKLIKSLKKENGKKDI